MDKRIPNYDSFDLSESETIVHSSNKELVSINEKLNNIEQSLDDESKQSRFRFRATFIVAIVAAIASVCALLFQIIGK